MNKMFDTHAHVDQLEDLEGALERAKEAGVTGIIAMSMDLASCKRSLGIKQRYQEPQIHLGMGIHPAEANLADLDETLALIKKHEKELVAVGEIGLDFWYKWVRKDQDKKDEQRKIFRALLEMAKEINLPAVIHSRGCWRECFETTKEVGLKKAEFHWYSGPIDVLDDILEQGYYVSTSPSLAYSPQSREAIAHAPIEQTLIETDCPVYYKDRNSEDGFKAEPKDVFKTLAAYCELKEIDEAQAIETFNQNTKDFFNL